MKDSELLCIAHSQMLPYAKQRMEQLFPNERINFFTAEDLKDNLRSCISQIRKSRYKKVVYFCYDLQTKKKLEKWKVLLLLSKGKEKLVIDWLQNSDRLTWGKYLIKDLPRLIAESSISPLIVFYNSYYSHRLLSLAKKSRKLKADPFARICYLRTDHWFGIQAGGSVTHISGVANGFVELGYQLFFISTDKLELIKEEKTPLYILRPSSFYRNYYEIPELAYNRQFVKVADKIFQKEKPTLIYQRNSVNNYSGIILSRRFDLPFILEYNGSEVWVARNWGDDPFKFERITERIELVNLHAADLVVVVSEPIKDTLLERGIEERKILVNPNGVDTETLTPLVDGSEIIQKYDLKDKITVGFIGTFGRWHGAEVLAEVAKPVLKGNSNIRFLFVGDGLTMPKVKEIINSDRVGESTILTGIVPQGEAPKYLAACDILVSPHVPMEDGSEFFGSPTKLFEYMAMGRAIVASGVGQIGEILRDNESAVLVEPGNRRELAEGILKLAADKALRERLGKKAREDVVANYTWQRNVQRVVEAYNALTKGN